MRRKMMNIKRKMQEKMRSKKIMKTSWIRLG
jgi:hypothetical protein